MYPYVTVIMPIKNEAEFIHRSLGAVLAQDYPHERMEVLVVDGMSTDRTHEIIRQLMDESASVTVRLLENRNGIPPAGLNLATQQAKGTIIIRVDGHCIIAHDYVRKCVEHIQTDGVEAVGGSMQTIGEGYISKVTAIAMCSKFGVGNNSFRTEKGLTKLVDTVPFPAYTREIIELAGPYDEQMIRNEDDEYNYRIRELGGKILLSGDVRSTYFSRTSLRGLWRQYFQYGLWKVRVLQKHPLQMSLRQFAPPTLVLGLILSALLLVLPVFFPLFRPLFSLFYLRPLSLVLPLLYLLANFSASVITSTRRGWNYLPVLPLTFAILHISYGLGFLIGLVRFIHRWGDRTGRVADWSAAHPSQTEPLVAEYSPSLASSIRGLLKRAFDILVSGLGLIILFPFLSLMSYLIRRESSGPAFTWEARIGRYGKPFNILKFRTRYHQPQSAPNLGWMAQDDGRFTPLGRWLHATKISELPQLWNVLRGEMSLVGPRPEVSELVRSWPVHARQEVLSVHPGITSPASVTYRDEEQRLLSSNLMDEYLKTVLPDKLRLDQLYVRSHSFLGDLDVIFLTLATLLPRLRETNIKPETLYNGFLSRLVRRYLSWFTIDSLVAFTAVSTAGLLWRMEGPLELGFGIALQLAALMAVLFSLVNSLRGLGRISWRSARPAYAFDILLSSAISTMGMAAINWFLPHSRFFPTAMIYVAGVLAFAGFLAVRYRERLLSGLAWRWLKRGRGMGERVLVVGAGDCALQAGWLLRHGSLSSAFSIVGMVDDDPCKEGMLIDGHRVFGLTRRIPELVQKMDIGLILFAIESIRAEDKERILSLCRQTPARLIVIPDLFALVRERLTQQVVPAPMAWRPGLDRLEPSTRPALLPGRSPELGSATSEGQD